MDTNQIVVMQITDIKDAVTAIRPVDPKNVKYQELKHALSLKTPGDLINAIIVRQEKNEATGAVQTILVEGLHRITAARELGWTEIPVRNMGFITRLEAMAIQMSSNAHRIAQAPAAEGKQYERMLLEDPNLALEDLARIGGTTVETVKSRLRLATNLTEQAQNLVDTKVISLQNAKTLAKLDKGLQDDDILVQAQSMQPDDFHNLITAKKKEITAARGPKEPTGFILSFKPRKKEEIKAELETGAVARRLFDQPDLQEAFLEGVRFSQQADAESAQDRKEKYEAQEAERKRKAESRKDQIAADRSAAAKAAAATNPE